jgi:hypothetical protein
MAKKMKAGFFGNYLVAMVINIRPDGAKTKLCLMKGFDLKRGCGWICYSTHFSFHGMVNGIGYGFSKNRFTAVREALKPETTERV